MADRRRYHRRANFVRDNVLERAICRRAAVENIRGLGGWAGLLRRPHRRFAGVHFVRENEEVRTVEIGRRYGTEHCPGLRLRANRLPDKRVLLWPSVRFALGDPLSDTSPDASTRPIRNAGPSNANLRIA